jgi:hypothetical protein
MSNTIKKNTTISEKTLIPSPPTSLSLYHDTIMRKRNK